MKQALTFPFYRFRNGNSDGCVLMRKFKKKTTFFKT